MPDELEHPIDLVSVSAYPDEAALAEWWAKQHSDSRPLAVVDRRDMWTEEIASLPSDIRASLPEAPEWHWAIYSWLGAAVAVPDIKTTYAVLTSRNYPIITRKEQIQLSASHVVIVGLSTGRSVAQQLARLGVGSVHLVDGDHLAPSNTNRLVGTRLTDMGLSKVLSTARELKEYNPYLEVSTQTAFLDEPGLREHLAKRATTAIVEMIDGFPAKVAIRRVAREHGIPVVMATDMDWDPMVDVDYPDAPMFGGRLSEDDLRAIEDPTTDFAAKTDIAMRFMALPKWAPRSFLSGQLARNGLVSYWSQTIPSVSTAGAMVARVVLDIARGSRLPASRAVISVRDALGTDDPLDTTEPLYEELAAAGGGAHPPQ